MILISKKPIALATVAIMALGLAGCNKASDNKAAGTEGSQPAAAATGEKTLDKIKKSGEIVLGYRDSSIPFSYIAGTPNQPVGYNLVTSQTRIPLVQNGTVDLECGSTTNNEERQKQVAFSNGFFEIGTRLLTAKDSGIKDFADLKGKTLVTTAGTTSERFIKKLNDDKKMGINIVSAKDHGESFLMLESGRAAAFMMDDVLLAGEKAKAKDPNKWVIVGTPQSYEIYGCMMRKDDSEFKKVVDDALVATYSSGEINDIYKKWFMSPIPPKNINMNFQMSDNLKALLANPHDGAQPKDAANAAASATVNAVATGASNVATAVASASNAIASAAKP